MKSSKLFCFKDKKNYSRQMRQISREEGVSTRVTKTHTARGFSDLYHVFTRKQCILCPALLHGCLTLLYVTSIRD